MVVAFFLVCYNLIKVRHFFEFVGADMIGEIKDILSIVISCATIITLSYTLFKFSRKPHDSLEQRHDELEKKVEKHDLRLDDIEESLLKGNDRFREQEETNATFKSVMLAFVNFEIAYCRNTGYEDNQDLLDAKTELSEYLTGKKHHEKD